MKIFDEKRAESFLLQEGFDVVAGYFIRNVRELQMSLRKLGFPVVMKASGVKVLHKKKVGGVKVGVKTYSDAIHYLKKFKKMRGSEGAVIQMQIKGKEFLVGVKLTSDFGHVIVFGSGGSEVEEKRDVSFRVVGLNKRDALKMINEVKGSKDLKKEDVEAIVEVILKVNELVKKYPKIREMDINPLMVEKGRATIVDARFVWE
jgi:succinyl-CoA synthetase beta subunit